MKKSIIIFLSLLLVLSLTQFAFAAPLSDSKFSVDNSVASENDVAYMSEISNLRINSATKLNFDFKKPNDGVQGYIMIWEGITIDNTKEPVYKQKLDGYAGNAIVAPGFLNFQRGAYTVAITADSDKNTVGATQSILSGQPVQNGMSSLVVTAKDLNYINAFFNRPSNAIASDDITWLILRSGRTLGKGYTLATQTSTPSASAGLVSIKFSAGTLKEGEWYNIVLNPGKTTQTFTAGYVFKYILN